MSSEGHEAEFDSRSLDAIADADPYPYWYEDTDQPLSNPTLVRTETCDLCIIGGGYTGLWAAIIAKERDPSRDVVLIDAHEIGSAASGRNGGFMDASLTHGIANGQERFPKEIALPKNSVLPISMKLKPQSSATTLTAILSETVSSKLLRSVNPLVISMSFGMITCN